MKNTILAIGLIFLSASCSILPPKVTNIGNAKVNSANKDKMEVGIDLGINNPSSFNYKLKSCNLQATVNGKPAGQVNIRGNKIVFKKKTTANYPIYMQINPADQLNSLNDVMDLLKGANKGVELKLEGILHIKAFLFGKKIPINFTQKVKLPSF